MSRWPEAATTVASARCFNTRQGTKINTGVQIGFRQARTTPTITQGQRLAWLKELLTGDAESLPYRVAGILLLLYAQPLTKIAALHATAVTRVDGETRIALGREPIPVPEPFASQLTYHLHHRPNLRTAGGAIGTPWLFPSNRPGQHLDPQSIMHRLRRLGINLLGARNTALQELVSEIPAPLVADTLGYSDQVTQKHAAEAGNTWARYASTTDRATTPTKPSGRTMTTDAPEDRRTDGADEPVGNVAEAALFDLDPPVRPYDVHLESLGAAATALDDARGAVQVAADALDEARSAARSAKERLTRAVVQGRQAGLSWAKIGEALGISQQRPINAGRDVCAISMTRATSDPAADDQSEIPFSP